jgi:segregation and condensation protein B
MSKKTYCDLQKSPSSSYFQVKRILEALLFSSSEPLPFAKMQSIIQEEFSISPKEIQHLLKELAEEYRFSNRAFYLQESEKGWQTLTDEEFTPYLSKLHEGRMVEKLSTPATEVLAIIAYKGPITRPAIDALRGVDCSNLLHALQERGLVEIVGKQETAGKPSLWGVTDRFLQHFGLKSLSELPQIEEV